MSYPRKHHSHFLNEKLPSVTNIELELDSDSLISRSRECFSGDQEISIQSEDTLEGYIEKRLHVRLVKSLPVTIHKISMSNGDDYSHIQSTFKAYLTDISLSGLSFFNSVEDIALHKGDVLQMEIWHNKSLINLKVLIVKKNHRINLLNRHMSYGVRIIRMSLKSKEIIEKMLLELRSRPEL